MNATRHVSWSEILDHVESGRPHGPIADHLHRCLPCQELEKEAAAILAALPIAGLPDPPSDLIHETWRKMSAIPTTAPARATLRGRLREIWAVLVTPPLVPSPAVRGMAAPRLMMYETDQYVVSLSISEGSVRTKRDILGKLIPRDAPRIPSDGQAILRHSGREQRENLTEFGGFRFNDVPSGEVRISIEVAGLLIHLPPLT